LEPAEDLFYPHHKHEYAWKHGFERFLKKRQHPEAEGEEDGNADPEPSAKKQKTVA